MDLPHAIDSARPLVSDMVKPFFEQVDPMELGQARRYLAVGEEYSRRVMERYSYQHLPKESVKTIVRELVWNYPSHGFVIDREEAKDVGLNVERLDDECTQLCEDLLSTVKGCSGVLSEDERKAVEAFRRTKAIAAAVATPAAAAVVAAASAPSTPPATPPVTPSGATVSGESSSNTKGKEEAHEIQTPTNSSDGNSANISH